MFRVGGRATSDNQFLQTDTFEEVSGTYGANFARLADLKKQFDPSNFFTNVTWPQNIAANGSESIPRSGTPKNGPSLTELAQQALQQEEELRQREKENKAAGTGTGTGVGNGSGAGPFGNGDSAMASGGQVENALVGLGNQSADVNMNGAGGAGAHGEGLAPEAAALNIPKDQRKSMAMVDPITTGNTPVM